MSNTIQDDKKVLTDGRQNEFVDKDDEGLKVTANLRDRIDQELIDKLEDDDIPGKAIEVWRQADADRVEFLQRQRKYLSEVDEFIEPIYKPSTDWGSSLHLPTTLTVCKTFHARFNSALTSLDPMFTVRARSGANVERAKLIEGLMQYTLIDWSNEYTGIKDTLDDWLWDWVTTGSGVLKARWDKKFTRFRDVEQVPFNVTELRINPQTGQDELQERTDQSEEIRTREVKIFDGPSAEVVNVEDIAIVGGNGDPQKADYVFQQSWLTASEMWSLADQKIFRKDIVEDIINAGEDSVTEDGSGTVKQKRAENSAHAETDKKYDLQRYHILECYLEADVDGSGINSQIIIWVHRKTRKLLRATYLYRTMPTGMRPFFKIDFHRRKDSEWGVGLVELLHSLSKEIDAMHNMRIDTGIITSLPWGFYRPISGINTEKLQIEPGALIPVENPSTDVSFPNLGNRTSFGFQEEAALLNQVERLTSISDLSQGIIGGQGATRTATGTRALLGEANANLDIFLQRMNRGWKQYLKYLFHQLQQKLPPGFDFRILGDDGNNYWGRVETREELQGMFDFEIDGNSANSNKIVQIEQADITFQLAQNPLLLQLGLVNPLNLYMAARNVLQTRGIKEISKYLTKPDQIVRVFTPMEVADRILAGIDVPFDPTQDLQGFIDLVSEIINNDDTLGQFGPAEVSALLAKQQEAQQLQAALQQAAAQNANIQQQQLNTQQGTAGQSFEQTQPIGALTSTVGVQGAQ